MSSESKKTGSLEAELKHKRELLDHIDTRIQELEVEGKAPLHLSIESAARKPDQAEGSNIQKLVLTFLGISFGSVTGIFFAFDYLDRRIRRPLDVYHALGYHPACVIAESTVDIPFHELISLAPDHEVSKAIRSFAVKLTLEKVESNGSIILFTGVDNGSGCTSIALNTAQALSSLSPKVLFIEGNIADQALRKLADVSETTSGLSDFLNSTEAWNNFIINNPKYNFSILPAGHSFAGNISHHRIHEFFESVRKEYDYICMDCAPILQSDLTEHIAIFADVIVLISVVESTLFGDLRKAAELLVHLKVPAIAPFLNCGAPKRSLSIDKLLEKQPEILDKINTQKIEEIIQNIPAAKELLVKIQKILNKTVTKKPSKTENQK